MQRGKRLTLRGTLPPKPGDGTKLKQYTISPGLPATPEGLKLAVIEAQRIEADLVYGRFNWNVEGESLTVARAIAEFEKHYWATRKKTIDRINNYKYDYLNHFLFLPQDEMLSIELLKKALLTSVADSRQRRGMTIAYHALLKHFKIESDLNRYKVERRQKAEGRRQKDRLEGDSTPPPIEDHRSLETADFAKRRRCPPGHEDSGGGFKPTSEKGKGRSKPSALCPSSEASSAFQGGRLGNYHPKAKRQIPTLSEIDEYYNLMRSPQWKWVFGIIACYGIRPHEIFHLDCSLMTDYPPALQVKERTKTGSRLVYPLPSVERVIAWKLCEPVLPNINTEGKSNMELGLERRQKAEGRGQKDQLEGDSDPPPIEDR